MSEITRYQLEELEETLSIDRRDFNELLEEYTGIVAKPYTAFVYYDGVGNYVGDSDNYDVREILENAYITVKENDDAVPHSGWRYVGNGCWQCLNCLDTVFQPTELTLNKQCPWCGAKIDI